MEDGKKGAPAMIVMIAKKRRDEKRKGADMDMGDKNHSLMAAAAAKRGKMKGMKGC